MPDINSLVPNIGRKMFESGKGAVDDDLSMTRSYHPGETSLAADDTRSNGDPDSHSCLDSKDEVGDEDNAKCDAPNVSITELESTLQQLLSEVDEDPLLVEHERKLREVTDRLGDYYRSNSQEKVDKVVEYLREIKARRLYKLANDVAAHLLFKQINPRYPAYPMYLTYSYLGPGTTQDPYSNAPFNQGLVRLFLGGLHIHEAKRFVVFHLLLCRLCTKHKQFESNNLYKTEIICGWGRRSKANRGMMIRKKALVKFFREKGVRYEEVLENPGALWVYLPEEDFDYESLRDEFEIDRGIAEGSGACVIESESESVEVTAPRSFVHRQASYEYETIISAGSRIPISMLTEKYGPDTGSWED